MKRIFAALILGGLVSTTTFAGVKVGQTLPEIKITDEGKVNLANDKITYSDFTSKSALGKTTVFLTMSARTSTSAMNEPFQNALRDAKLPKGTINAVTVVRLKEAMFGTQALALSTVKGKQKANPDTTFVVDATNTAKDKWDLKKKSYAVIVTDAKGKVIKFKDGKLSDAEIADFVAAVKKSAGH